MLSVPSINGRSSVQKQSNIAGGIVADTSSNNQLRSDVLPTVTKTIVVTAIQRQIRNQRSRDADTESSLESAGREARP